MSKIRTGKDLLEKLNETMDKFEAGEIDISTVSAVTKLSDAMCKVVKTSLDANREMLRFDGAQDHMIEFVKNANKIGVKQ